MKNKPYKIKIEVVNEYVDMRIYENEHKPYPTKRIVIKPYDVYIENNRLNNIINELERDFERKIQSCTIEAETTTNDFYCRLHIATLKRWLNKIKELKGSDK